ncbi:putative flavin-containing monooxygenase 1 [Platanthera zijinensis]|uniref:Flavin-containing monooxygenase n=1 Tax=Platanthera zijinensis TaxID=2320716 RepID=A0AAP0G7J4_9ASPA
MHSAQCDCDSIGHVDTHALRNSRSRLLLVSLYFVMRMGGCCELHKCHRAKVHVMDFIILCIGRYSGLPNVPTFPKNKGHEVFKGKVIHSMDYSNMGSTAAAELVKGKRVIVVGYVKSALDIAAECANINGLSPLREAPLCIVPKAVVGAGGERRRKNRTGGVEAGIKTCRFVDFSSVRREETEPAIRLFSRCPAAIPPNGRRKRRNKPSLSVDKTTPSQAGEGLMLSLIATLLSPLLWIFIKLTESYLLKTIPMKKYKMVPEQSFFEDVSSGLISQLPENFYDKVEEGSIILKPSKAFEFYKDGILAEGETTPIETDLVIYATGFKGAQKIRNIFISPWFQEIVAGTEAAIPLYRLPSYKKSHTDLYVGVSVVCKYECSDMLCHESCKCNPRTRLYAHRPLVPPIREASFTPRNLRSGKRRQWVGPPTPRRVTTLPGLALPYAPRRTQPRVSAYCCWMYPPDFLPSHRTAVGVIDRLVPMTHHFSPYSNPRARGPPDSTVRASTFRATV